MDWGPTFIFGQRPERRDRFFDATTKQKKAWLALPSACPFFRSLCGYGTSEPLPTGHF